MTVNATRVECGTLGTDPCAYRVVAEQLPGVAVFVFDRDLRFELVTDAAVGDTGWRPEEVIDRTLFELVPPERVERYAGPFRAALAGGRQRFDVEGWQDPAKVWAVDIVPVLSADGAITGGLVFACDVTEPRRTERELRERGRQLAEAQRIARVGNWEWHLASGTGSASAEWFRMVGVRPEDIPSPAAALEFVHPTTDRWSRRPSTGPPATAPRSRSSTGSSSATARSAPSWSAGRACATGTAGSCA